MLPKPRVKFSYPRPRLSERPKRMTIAAGIVCGDGIVMCADSQESYGDFKWPVKKLSYPRSTVGDTAMVISGAGFGPAIDTATQEIISQLSHSMFPLDVMLRKIREILREIYEKDLPIHPAERTTDLDFRLLMALRGEGGRTGLFVTSGTLIKRVDDFEIIGCGDVITKFFAHMSCTQTILGNPVLSMYQGTVLAAYLIYLAKSQMTTIGGKSQIFTLSWEGQMRSADAWELPEWEKFFAAHQFESQELMLACANPTISTKNFDERLKHFTTNMRARKRKLVKQRAHWDRLWKQYAEAGAILLGHTPTPSASRTLEDQQ
jgi:hypothetical protein